MWSWFTTFVRGCNWCQFQLVSQYGTCNDLVLFIIIEMIMMTNSDLIFKESNQWILKYKNPIILMIYGMYIMCVCVLICTHHRILPGRRITTGTMRSKTYTIGHLSMKAIVTYVNADDPFHLCTNTSSTFTITSLTFCH